MHARGVPYHVGGTGQDGGRMDVDSQAAGQVAVLTIEPGVTIQFPPGGVFNVGPGSGTAPSRGALIAIGGTDPVDRIVFTSDKSAASQAGDWLGIVFGGAVDTRSVMQNVRVEFAGGTSTTGSNSCPYPGSNGINDAAIRIFGPPLTQFITGTEILSSLHHGIDRGWRADLQPDYLAGNTITTVAASKQTVPPTSAGVSPVRLMRWFRLSPSSHSIASHISPSRVRPSAMKRTMPGCRRPLSTRTSRANRSAASSDALRSTLNATGVPLLRSVARYTVPMPPEPATSCSSKRLSTSSPGRITPTPTRSRGARDCHHARRR
jgi:hypothetical protein